MTKEKIGYYKGYVLQRNNNGSVDVIDPETNKIRGVFKGDVTDFHRVDDMVSADAFALQHAKFIPGVGYRFNPFDLVKKNSVESKNNKVMKSFKRASVLKGAKCTWRGKSKNGNTVHLYTKKGVKGIRAVTYRTKNGPRVMVTTQRVYKLR